MSCITKDDNSLQVLYSDNKVTPLKVKVLFEVLLCYHLAKYIIILNAIKWFKQVKVLHILAYLTPS